MDFDADLRRDGLAATAVLSLAVGDATKAQCNLQLPNPRMELVARPGKTFAYLWLLAARYAHREVAQSEINRFLHTAAAGNSDWASVSESEFRRKLYVYRQAFEALVDLARLTQTSFADPPLHENDAPFSAHTHIVTLAGAPCAPPANSSRLSLIEELPAAA